MSAILLPLSAMTLVQAMTAMALVTVPVLTPEIAAALDVDTTAVGFYQSLAFAGAACLTLLSGSLVLRHGGIRVNQTSIVISVLGLGLAITGMAPIVALGAVLAGMGYGLAAPGASHILAKATPPARRGLVFSIKQSAVPLGGLIAGVLLPPVAERFGWASAIVLACLMMLSAALLIEPLRARLDADRDPAHRIGIGAPARSVGLILTTPGPPPARAGGVQLRCDAVVAVRVPGHVPDRAGRAGSVTAGLLFSVMQGAGIAGRVAWGLGERPLDPRAAVARTARGRDRGQHPRGDHVPGRVAARGLALACAALGFTAVGWNGIYLAEIARVVPPEKVGAATGGMLLFTFTGVVFGPPSFGTIVATTGSYTAAFIAIDVLLLATLAVLMIRPRRGGQTGSFRPPGENAPVFRHPCDRRVRGAPTPSGIHDPAPCRPRRWFRFHRATCPRHTQHRRPPPCSSEYPKRSRTTSTA